MSPRFHVDERTVSAACRAVTLASALTRRVGAMVFSETSITKVDRSPVTIADFAVQALVTHILREELGARSLVAEEQSDLLVHDEGRHLLEATRGVLEEFWPGVEVEAMLEAIDFGAQDTREDVFWTLDPIDGTRGFLRRQQYCVSLALIAGGRPVLGILGCPHMSIDTARPLAEPDPVGALFFATEGEGTRVVALGNPLANAAVVKAGVQDTTISASSRDSRPDAPDEAAHLAIPEGPVLVCQSVDPEHTDQTAAARVLDASGLQMQAVRVDSQCKYAVAARGQAHVYLRVPASPEYAEWIWDHAAGALIAQEAGCLVTDLAGHVLDFSRGRRLDLNHGILAAPPLLHARLKAGIHEALSDRLA